MNNLAQKLENTVGSDLINERFLFEGTRIDWDFVQNFQSFEAILSVLSFLEKQEFEALYYVNDGVLQEEFLLKKENLVDFLSFVLKNVQPYHYLVEKSGHFVVFFYNEREVYYGEYMPVVKILSDLQEKIAHLELQLKNASIEEKKTLIAEKNAWREAIFQIKFCQQHQISAKTIQKVHTLHDPNTGGFFHLRISCDNETNNPKYWREIQKILLQNGDLIVEKK